MERQLSFMLVLFCMAACNVEKKESPEAAPAAKKFDRNMFGHRVARGLQKAEEGLMDGYVMFAVTNSAYVYLVNRKGEVVHSWKGNYSVQGGYLMDDGSLVLSAVDPDFPVFAGGGESGRLQRISWDGKMLWDFEYADEKAHTHHDFAVMPNGNVLAIAWEARTPDEVLAAGRKPELIPKAGLWPDKVIEIAPEGLHGGKVVWEWRIWDHLVQDFDKTKANFGDPGAHPELLDINSGDPLPPPITQDSMDVLHAQHRAWRNQTPENLGSDVYHMNAIKYNAALDQIALSSPRLSEILIIDHSTTTRQAAGHSGGRYNKGGDFLYRWGNPQNYRHGDSTQQMLYHQHDVRWIDEGMPGAGNLMIFNNDIPNKDSLNFSAVYEITPPMNKNGTYIYEKGKPFGPEKPAWAYVAPDTISFYSGFISGAHRMRNGNTFINEGARGRFFEVTPDGKTVWEYLTPYRGEIRNPNGDPKPPMPMTYIQFRATFIPVDHPAFKNKKLEPIQPQPPVFRLPDPPAEKSAGAKG